jgi:hypothetical protein
LKPAPDRRKSRVAASGLFGGTSTRHYDSFGAACRAHWPWFVLVPGLVVASLLLRHSKWVWVPMVGMLLVFSFAMWVRGFGAARTLSGTPRAKVASAAQGYAELAGEAVALAAAVDSPFSGVPCLWYRYLVERKSSKGEWTTSDWGVSREPFVLRDETGDCVIDPDGFEVVSYRTETWQAGGERRTEHLIMAGDPLYAIGDFRTDDGTHRLRPAAGRTSLVSNFTEAELARKAMIASVVWAALFVGCAAFAGWLTLRTLHGG